MTLTHILVFAVLALGIGLFSRVRKMLMLAASILAVYWLQPETPIRNLDFWLPTVSLALAVFVWAVTRERNAPPGENVPGPGIASRVKGFFRGGDGRAGLLLVGLILGVAFTRYLGPVCCLTPTRPPDIGSVLAVLAILSLCTALFLLSSGSRRMYALLVGGILLLFLILKTEFLAQGASMILRKLAGQSPELASAPDIRWLGFSYIAFRLIHTLRDRATGRLPGLSLGEYLTYLVFFPALAAGPIDRVQRFLPELRAEGAGPFAENLRAGGRRIITGILKKFILADSLALVALNGLNAGQVRSAGWMWLLLYAYAFRIYFDFSGYTDIALGLGRWMGFSLPENFNRPYTRPNLTAFWNSWHITLAQWFRAYFFNPLTRALRSSRRNLPLGLIIFLGQLSTMLLIGLWHGVTWNFALWGVWHGLGLFAHNRWSEANRARLAALESHRWRHRVYSLAATAVTFQFVALGWVWFALPSVESSAAVFLRLFGWTG